MDYLFDQSQKPTYTKNFENDCKVAVLVEKRWQKMMMERDGVTTAWLNRDWRFDVGVELKNGKFEKWEVKDDTLAERTGNIGVEFECRGKKSGINRTRANGWVFHLYGGEWWMITTRDLRKAITDNLYFRIAIGGDKDSFTKMYLFKSEVLKAHMKPYVA